MPDPLSSGPSSGKRPNILLITTDQQHYSLLGSLNPRLKTPHLDRLAAQGTRFERAYCPNPTCTPTRASLITGMYPSQHGAWSLGTKLFEDVPTLGDHLRTAGYESHLIGKAHFQQLADVPSARSIESQPLMRNLDYWRQFRGPWYGFDVVETARMHTAEAHAGQHYALWLEEKGLTDWRKYFNDPDPTGADSGNKYKGPKPWDLPEELHYNYWIAEKTLENIRRCRDEGRPFMSWASFFDPHPPYVVPEPWYSMYDPADLMDLVPEYDEHEMDDMPPPHQMTRQEKADWDQFQESPHANHGYHSHLDARRREFLAKITAIYYGMMSFTDHTIGLVLDGLAEMGLADDTLVAFTSDHGHYYGQHGLMAKGPFHYEDGIRVPMIVRWPGQVPAGKVDNSMQSLVDYAPTFLKVAGVEVPGVMTGLDQSACWRGEADSPRDWCLIENRHQETAVHLLTLVTKDAKLTVYRGREWGELFDLANDPDEKKNLWNDPSATDLKQRMLLKLAHARMEAEPTRMPRVAVA